MVSNTLFLGLNIWSIKFFWFSSLRHSIFLGVRNLTWEEHPYQGITCVLPLAPLHYSVTTHPTVNSLVSAQRLRDGPHVDCGLLKRRPRSH